MSGAYRRYEILLPLKFNNGTPVSRELLTETFLELRARFGAISAETQSIQGSWIHEGQEYTDELVRYFVDIPDSPDNATYFRDLKEVLKTRFQQIDIWMTTYPVEII